MAPTTTIRRLLRETLELSADSSNPNPSFLAHPVSDDDLYEWHFTLAGPPAPSPFSGGLYHGRISLPRSYPLKPPNFRFLTPSARFEVNREICLSISGFHEESWMPAWGIRTALVALRAFMGEEGTTGQVGGMEATKEVRAKVAQTSRSWKCEACGGRTNEKVMQEWWETCKAKGVKVGEEAGLEELPESLKLVFKDELKGKRQEKDKGEEPLMSQAETKADSGAFDMAERPAMGPGQQPVEAPSLKPPQSSEASNFLSPTSNGLSSRHPEDLSQLPQPTRTLPLPLPPPEQSTPTPILDKAISGLFVALFLMVLKKILYNQSVSQDY